MALNTAGALANHLGKKVILIDSDRRSGIISILLNLARRNGLLEALRRAGDLTSVEWEQHVVRAAGIDLLLADPGRQAHLPTWADYYQLLNFLESRYDYIVVDMPEVVNPATAEVVRSAGSVFVVCTTEIPSIKLAQQRFRELADCGIASPNLHLLVNRLTGGGPTADFRRPGHSFKFGALIFACAAGAARARRVGGQPMSEPRLVVVSNRVPPPPSVGKPWPAVRQAP